MILQGFLLWVGMSVLVTTVANALFRFSFFESDSNLIKNLKILIVIVLSELVSISYVLLNDAVGIFGLWGIVIYKLEDAILSGILISGGADFVYQIYKTIVSFKEKVEAQKDIARKVADSYK
ncbi:MAG: hypothetical protein QXF86_03220 [Candidatus Bilamarchaeaceae archaeon]